MDLSVMFLGILMLFVATLLRFLQRNKNFGDYSSTPQSNFADLGSIKGTLIWGQWIGGYWIIVSLVFDSLLAKIISPILQMIFGSILILFPFFVTFLITKYFKKLHHRKKQ